MTCKLFANSEVRWEREVEEGREMIGRAGTRAEEARRRGVTWRSFMLKWSLKVLN